MNNKYIYRPYKNNKIHENFLGLVSAGNSRNANNNVNINKDIDIKTNIDRSTMIESVNKLVNDVVNEVGQKNSAEVMNSVAASNRINLHGIDCDVIEFDNINQGANATSTNVSTIVQKQENKIKTSISNSIKKKITNSLPKDVNEIQNKNNEMINQFRNTVPGLRDTMSNATKMLDGACNFGYGNSTNVDTNFFSNESLKKTLNLDESFKVNDNDEISNTIKNVVKQENLVTCTNKAIASNEINLKDIKCGNLKIKNVEQEAAAKALLNCTINQEIRNEITTKVTNTLDKLFERMYDSAKDNDSRKRIAAFSQAIGETMRNAAGIPPKEIPDSVQVNDKQQKPEPKPEPKPLEPDFDDSPILDDIPIAQPVSQPVVNQSNMVVFLGQTMTVGQRNIYIGIGVVVLLVIIVLIVKK